MHFSSFYGKLLLKLDKIFQELSKNNFVQSYMVGLNKGVPVHTK